ncbi:MAG: glycosyl transferase family protein [Sneathiella sp.]|nr:glycosyl transferase family protein [Sneathiella sp.]
MSSDHPFAQYVRALGKGPNMWRDLSFEEAKDAMNMILNGEVNPLQIGAFLMLLRRKGETGEELAGMTAAAQDLFEVPDKKPQIDYDWPSYADRHRQQPWFILAAILLADQGYKILMHGIEGYADGLAPTRPGLSVFNVPQVTSLAEAAEGLKAQNLVYAGLEHFCQPLQDLFELRPLLGVRTAVNTFGRDLNPLNAPCQMQGVFHPPYKALHLSAAEFLKQPNALIFKGGGGEVMRNPMKAARVDALIDGEVQEIVWPALTGETTYKWRDEDLSPDQLLKMWQGELDLPVPILGIIGTLSVALKMKHPSKSPDELDQIARDIWNARDKERFS